MVIYETIQLNWVSYDLWDLRTSRANFKQNRCRDVLWYSFWTLRVFTILFRLGFCSRSGSGDGGGWLGKKVTPISPPQNAPIKGTRGKTLRNIFDSTFSWKLQDEKHVQRLYLNYARFDEFSLETHQKIFICITWSMADNPLKKQALKRIYRRVWIQRSLPNLFVEISSSCAAGELWSML